MEELLNRTKEEHFIKNKNSSTSYCKLLLLLLLYHDDDDKVIVEDEGRSGKCPLQIR